jgi:hypothetical protein
MANHPIRFGLQTGQQNVEWSQMLDLWRKADGWGYDSLWNFDHFFPIFTDPSGPCFEGWTTLAALAHVAGYTVGQDVSDRRLQFADAPPQFSLGKSIDGYGPLGPAVVSLDAFADPNDLSLTCDVSGERMQDGRTSDMVFGVQTGQQNVEWSSMLDTWQKADSWGYDSLWNFDHFYPIFVDPEASTEEPVGS